MSILPAGFDFASQSTAPQFQRTQYGKTYKYDFVAGDFVVDGITGKVIVLDTTAAFAQCIEKIWRTERYKFLVYNGDYGADVVKTIRDGNTDAELLLIDLNRVVVEGAMSDPRTTLVTDVDLTLNHPTNPTSARIRCNVRDIFGKVTALDATILVP